MTTPYPDSDKEMHRSQDHEGDSLTYLGIVDEAQAGLISAGRGLETADSHLVEAFTLFATASVKAYTHASLANAAAVRELAAVVDDIRRAMP
jgi:hypothetical protein